MPKTKSEKLEKIGDDTLTSIKTLEQRLSDMKKRLTALEERYAMRFLLQQWVKLKIHYKLRYDL